MLSGAFHLYDLDDDGYITREEMLNIVEAIFAMVVCILQTLDNISQLSLVISLQYIAGRPHRVDYILCVVLMTSQFCTKIKLACSICMILF